MQGARSREQGAEARERRDRIHGLDAVVPKQHARAGAVEAVQWQWCSGSGAAEWAGSVAGQRTAFEDGMAARADDVFDLMHELSQRVYMLGLRDEPRAHAQHQRIARLEQLLQPRYYPIPCGGHNIGLRCAAAIGQIAALLGRHPTDVAEATRPRLRTDRGLDVRAVVVGKVRQPRAAALKPTVLHVVVTIALAGLMPVQQRVALVVEELPFEVEILLACVAAPVGVQGSTVWHAHGRLVADVEAEAGGHAVMLRLTRIRARGEEHGEREVLVARIRVAHE